jgi:arginyl-tRNA synthetase
MDPFKPISDALLAALPGVDADAISFLPPPNPALGDVSVPMFLAARKLGAPPPKVAADAAAADFGGWVSEARPAGPYLNLRVNRARLAAGILQSIQDAGERYGSGQSGAGQRVLIEHTSINPNASPHVGRARNALIGDGITRLLRFEGFDCEVHYYVNDMGRQIGLLVLIASELENLSFDQILDAYVQANERAEKEPEFAAQGYELLAKMEEGDPETQRQFHAVTDLCLKGQLAVLARIGAHYDVFDRESGYVKDARLEKVLEALRARDAVFVDDDQRLVVDLSKLGYAQEEGRYFVLMRANGSSMYGYRDIAYTIHKIEQAGPLHLWVLGEDHKLYAEQQALILKAAGYTPPETIYYSYILLKSGKMSTRQGKVVLLSDFLDQAIELAAERVAEQCKDLSAEEQRAIAERVAIAAVRFSILRVSPNKNVTFDLEGALAFTGDTGPYVQYSCARIHSILRKHGDAAAPRTIGEQPLTSDAEWQLLLKLAGFPQVVSSCVGQRSVAPIANYALELARQFTSFYHECPVLTAGDEALVHARILLCRATLQTLTNALGILGIEAPERM